MPRKLSPRNPSKALLRTVVAARRAGLDAACSCGENRPEALIAGIKPPICAECHRIKAGHTTRDDHHPFGRANSPITISIPVNDHRARLSVDQMDWPKSTLRNPQGSPLLSAAACIRGFIDVVLYLIEEGLLWIADMLEQLDQSQVKKLGPKWWLKTELEHFAPKRKPNEKS
jgi:hypothetical protein